MAHPFFIHGWRSPRWPGTDTDSDHGRDPGNTDAAGLVLTDWTGDGESWEVAYLGLVQARQEEALKMDLEIGLVAAEESTAIPATLPEGVFYLGNSSNDLIQLRFGLGAVGPNGPFQGNAAGTAGTTPATHPLVWAGAPAQVNAADMPDVRNRILLTWASFPPITNQGVIRGPFSAKDRAFFVNLEGGSSLGVSWVGENDEGDLEVL